MGRGEDADMAEPTWLSSGVPRMLWHGGAAVVQAARVLWRRPWVSVGLGVSLLLGLLSVACGIGLLLAPWFVTELLALHLRAAGLDGVEHHRGWLGAWLVEAAAMAFVGLGGLFAIAWLAEPAGDATVGGGEPLAALLGAAVAVVAMLPWLFAPLVLLDRGGSVPFALYQSARLMATAGLLRSLGFSLLVHGIQVLPLVAAAVVRLLVPDVPPLLLVGLALAGTVVSLPLGQGAVAAGYLRRRDEVPTSARAAQAVEPGFALSVGAAASVVLPLLAAVVVAGSVLARPTRVRPVAAPSGLVVLEEEVRGARLQLPVPGTTLVVQVASRRLAVVAPDGGGAGRIPLAFEAPIERLRVVRRAERLWVEVVAGERRWSTVVDEAGVRLDDGLAARLAERLPPWAGLLFGAALVLGGFLGTLALASLGEAARSEALPEPLRPPPDWRARGRAAARRRLARWIGPWLACGLVAGWLAWRAAFG